MPECDRREFMKLAAAAQVLVLTQCGSSSSPAAPSSPPPTSGSPSTPPATTPPTTPVGPPSNAPIQGLPEVRSTPEGNDLVIVVDGTPLAQVGGMARTDGAANGLHRYVLLARTASDRVAALNGICTHEQCVVTLQAAPAFQCPCHGSQYDHAGNVLRGPAPAALPILSVAFDGRTARVRF